MATTRDELVATAASRPSLLRAFSIVGLFGYRTVSLSSEYAATILMAKNGAGKTTMLGALDSFLRCQFGRLEGLVFDYIVCELKGVDQPIFLYKRDLDLYLSKCNGNSSVAKIAAQYEIDIADVLFFALWEYSLIKSNLPDLLAHSVFSKVYQHSSQTFESAQKLFSDLSSELELVESPVIQVKRIVASALKGIEVVYLPTYRRIELSLPEPEESKYKYRRQQSVQSKLGLTRRGLQAGDIQFGLSDISARLRKMNQDILSESNQRYAEISANIIDDLISGAFEQTNPNPDDWPTPTELDIFFDRLKSGRREFGFGPFYGPFNADRIPDVRKIYSGDIPENSQKFLTYFLGKLNSVIQKTRKTEQVVERFVESCNRYLSAEDPTTNLGDYLPEEDDKVLRLDRGTLDISVWRTRLEREIPLDALSSGEKQMISLFSRLYLYPGEKLILVDEPELSLSLDWQRKILPDILASELCGQVIAITHSPFIFDNALDAFAKPLYVKAVDSVAGV